MVGRSWGSVNKNITYMLVLYMFLTVLFMQQELATGEPVLVDLNEESDNEDQDFDAWEPDPVDADPSKCYLRVHISLIYLQ